MDIYAASELLGRVLYKCSAIDFSGSGFSCKDDCSSATLSQIAGEIGRPTIREQIGRGDEEAPDVSQPPQHHVGNDAAAIRHDGGGRPLPTPDAAASTSSSSTGGRETIAAVATSGVVEDMLLQEETAFLEAEAATASSDSPSDSDSSSADDAVAQLVQKLLKQRRQKKQGRVKSVSVRKRARQQKKNSPCQTPKKVGAVTANKKSRLHFFAEDSDD